MSQDPWTNNDEYSLAVRNPSGEWRYGPQDRVVLGWKGLVAGIVVADVVFFLSWTLPSLSTNPNNTSYALSMMGVMMVVGLVPIGFVGVAVGWPLGWLLRRIRSQWVHVAAFFVAGALICVPFGGFWNSEAWAFPLSIALAAAIGRLAIWKLVVTKDEPSIT